MIDMAWRRSVTSGETFLKLDDDRAGVAAR